MKNLIKYFWLACLGCLGLPPSHAATSGDQVSANFIFIVNTSGGMKSRSSAVSLVVANLIERGVSGTMKAGDTFTIWTYSDSVQTTNFTPQVWTPEMRRPVSNVAFAHLERQRWQGRKAQLNFVISRLHDEIRAKTNLCVYLFNTGEEFLMGTGFDGPINEAWKKNNQVVRDLEAVCVTALVVEKGHWVDWGVAIGLPPDPIRTVARNPEPVPVAPPAPPPAVAAVTNVPVAKVETAPPPTVISRAKPSQVNQGRGSPKRATKKGGAKSPGKTASVAPRPKAKPPLPAEAKTEEQPSATYTPPPLQAMPSPPVTTPVEKPQPPVTSPPKTVADEKPKPAAEPLASSTPPVPSPVPSTAPPIVSEKATPPAAPAEFSPRQPPPELPSLDIAPVVTTGQTSTPATPVAASTPVPAPTPLPETNPAPAATVVAPVVAAAPAIPPRGSDRLLLVGLFLLAAGGWIAYLWHRHTHQAAGTSLITHSMNREPKPSERKPGN